MYYFILYNGCAIFRLELANDGRFHYKSPDILRNNLKAEITGVILISRTDKKHQHVHKCLRP